MKMTACPKRSPRRRARGFFRIVDGMLELPFFRRCFFCNREQDLRQETDARGGRAASRLVCPASLSVADPSDA